MLKHVKFTSLAAILATAFVYCTAISALECPLLTGPDSEYDKSKWLIVPTYIQRIPEGTTFTGATWNIGPEGIACTYNFRTSSPFANHFTLFSNNIVGGPKPITAGSKWVINLFYKNGVCKSDNYTDCPFTDF